MLIESSKIKKVLRTEIQNLEFSITEGRCNSYEDYRASVKQRAGLQRAVDLIELEEEKEEHEDDDD